MSFSFSYAALGWSSLFAAIVPMSATAAPALPLPNDPMEPIADAAQALTGPLAGAIVVTRDLAAARRAYVEGLGLTMRGPIAQDPQTMAERRRLWGMPADLGWEVYVMERVSVPDAIRILVLVPDRDTPVIRNTFAREETGPYALGFPMREVDTVDRQMVDLGFKRTLPNINRYELQLRDGTPYPISEASYEVTDNTRLVALSRGGGLPQNGSVEPDSGIGGPAYSSLIVEDVEAMESFFTRVLDYERRSSREWTNFSPRFRYLTLHALGARTGNLGLVEYAVADRQPASGVPPRPPNRGLAAWSFPVRSVDAILERARLQGATILAGPLEHDDPRFGVVRVATLLAPNGMLIEIIEQAGRSGAP
jgi:catechol 2,3-dioxygenase-like lactoylglutathione lyase family enzyme